MKRFGVFLLLILIIAGISTRAVHAQEAGQTPTTTTSSRSLPSPEEFGAIFDERDQAGQTSKEVYLPNTSTIMMDHMICSIRGCSQNPESSYYYGKSAVASVGNVIAMMYVHPPADLALWIRDTGESLGFVPKQAYAQGIGFTGLSVILPIWRGFRNISYALLALIMIIIGFMVMFRRKIDPKTVVTVQNALPRIVLTIVLITFSYAIAAFFIDLMYLVMAIIINLLVTSSGGSLGTDTASKYISGNLGTAFNALFAGGFSSFDDLMKILTYYDSPAGSFPWFVQWAVTIGTFGLGPLVFGILVGLILAIALLFGIVRIAFMLISAYIQIIVSVLVAPFQLLTQAIPGSTSLSSWIKNLVANLSVFPVTAGMLLIGTIITQSNAGTIWTPPLLASQGSNGIVGLIGLGILLTIPNVANAIKEGLKAKAPVEAGLGAILGPVGGGVGQLVQYGYYASMAGSMFRKQPGGGHEPSDLSVGMKGQQQGIPGGQPHS